MSVKPASFGGSTSPPFLIKSCAETSGVLERSMTITRKPFASVFSAGLGNCGERGVAGGGGVACGVCALMTAHMLRRVASATRQSIRSIGLFTFIFPALLSSFVQPHAHHHGQSPP